MRQSLMKYKPLHIFLSCQLNCAQWTATNHTIAYALTKRNACSVAVHLVGVWRYTKVRFVSWFHRNNRLVYVWRGCSFWIYAAGRLDRIVPAANFCGRDLVIEREFHDESTVQRVQSGNVCLLFVDKIEEYLAQNVSKMMLIEKSDSFFCNERSVAFLGSVRVSLQPYRLDVMLPCEITCWQEASKKFN